MKCKKVYVELIFNIAITIIIPFISKLIASIMVILCCLTTKAFYVGKKYININDSINRISKSNIIISVIAIITILLIYLWSEKIKKEKLLNRDLSKLECLENYIKGFFIGGLSITVIFMIVYLLDKPKVEIKQFSFCFIICVITWIIQGFSEEILFRGYLLQTISKNFNFKVAVIINSVVFSLIHIMNSGYSIIAFINLFMFGVIESFLRVNGSLWKAAAFHSSWNLFQGNIFGLSVSGFNQS